jgi:signal transduction histidine kinase
MQDDGKSFDLDKFRTLEPAHQKIGMIAMEERVRMFGAHPKSGARRSRER